MAYGGFDNEKQFGEGVGRAADDFKLDLLQDQETHLEVWYKCPDCGSYHAGHTGWNRS